MLSQRRAATLASAAVLMALVPSMATAAPAEPPPPPSIELPPPAPAAPLSGVLVSEVASGGPGSAENFIEITNYGTAPTDVSGWKIFRCGQTGDGYGPQAVIPDGTMLAPGEQFTAVREGGDLDDGRTGDMTYSTSLHSFGFGAFLQDARGRTLDRIGFYHENIDGDCRNPVSLQHRASWAHSQSHQRVGLSGDVTKDWIVAGRTPGEENATEWEDITTDGDIVISEYAPGGPAGYNDDFIELANAGDRPADISGWKVWRCGDNAQTYAQSTGLPEGTVLEPGEVFTLGRSGSPTPADIRYSTSLHWINSGAMVLTPDERIVDRFSMYADRVSPCTDGTAKAMDISVLDGESYQRVGRTGDNAEDFRAARRTPGEWPAPEELAAVEIADSPHAGSLQITEITGGGPDGGNDEFIELTNLGQDPVDLAGWRLHRCEGTGRMALDPQVADLGRTLAPGETFVAAHRSSTVDAPDATYRTGLNEADGYGAVVFDADGARVDGVGVYDTVPQDHCGRGLTAQNNLKTDTGETYQRARSTGGSYDDFVKAERSPGAYVDHPWHDPATPRAGQLDPATVERSYRPGTPVTTADGSEPDEDGSLRTAVRTEHATSAELEVSFRSATPVALDTAATRIWAGTTGEIPPPAREIDGERHLAPTDELMTEGGTGDYPFQRFEIAVEEVPVEGLEVVWNGRTQDRNELQLYGWNPSAEQWELVTAGEPSADGDVVLIGRLPEAMVTDDRADLLVMDGPRTNGGLFDEVSVTDGAFADPGIYDAAINHMTDTQFYSEGFVGVFTDMVAWVVANADARKIAYNSLTGDIIENWIGGNSDPVRARREFDDAARIVGLMNTAGVPNGVLPGNHDNLWGRNNDLYNEYFGSGMFEGQPWWGNSWRPGDNSAHYDWFEHDGTKFLVVNLPYRPSDEQMSWASSVARANPSYNVVLATHSYLYTDGTVEDVDRRHTARGRAIWDTVVAPNDNVFLVIGGHYHGVATNSADPVTGDRVDVTELNESTVVVDGVGQGKRRVVEMLADYQGYRSTQPEARSDLHDRDTGFQRLLQLDLDAGLMGVNAYSPTLDSFDAWKYDEPDFRGENARYGPEDDEFVVQLSLTRPTSFSTTNWLVQGTSSEESRERVRAGEIVEHAWEAEQAGLNWYAVSSVAERQTEGISALDARERAAEGALLEERVEEQIVPMAQADPYPAQRSALPAPQSEPEPEATPETEETPEPEETPEAADATESAPEDAEETREEGQETSAPPTEEEPVSPEEPEEPGDGRMQALVEPGTASGPMVATIPALLGTAGETGPPVDPGQPGEPGGPDDPGQDPGPSVPGGPGTGTGPGGEAPGTEDTAADRTSRSGDGIGVRALLPGTGSPVGPLLIALGLGAVGCGAWAWRRRQA